MLWFKKESYKHIYTDSSIKAALYNRDQIQPESGLKYDEIICSKQKTCNVNTHQCEDKHESPSLHVRSSE